MYSHTQKIFSTCIGRLSFGGSSLRPADNWVSQTGKGTHRLRNEVWEKTQSWHHAQGHRVYVEGHVLLPGSTTTSVVYLAISERREFSSSLARTNGGGGISRCSCARYGPVSTRKNVGTRHIFKPVFEFNTCQRNVVWLITFFFISLLHHCTN